MKNTFYNFRIEAFSKYKNQKPKKINKIKLYKHEIFLHAKNPHKSHKQSKIFKKAISKKKNCTSQTMAYKDPSLPPKHTQRVTK